MQTEEIWGKAGQRASATIMNLPTGATVWFCVRRNGIQHNAGWIDATPLSALRKRVGADHGETVEVCVTSDYRTIERKRFRRVFSNRSRGLIGIELTLGAESTRLAPTRMIASNRSFHRALERFLARQSAGVDELWNGGHVRAFSAQQFLLPGPQAGRSPVGLFRGSTLIEAAPTLDRNEAVALGEGIEKWMLANLSAQGALPYKYWPSRGETSPADNAIRRLLATIALGRWGRMRGSRAIQAAATRNLRFNLRRYFRAMGDGRGVLVERAGAKLGATALAGLAIIESAAPDEFGEELAMIASAVASLEDDRLGFRTFFFPRERDGDNWNFYSGEALLFWAEAARRRTSSAPSVERCIRVFERCRNIHRRNRNPAFVPWHTQAGASLFAQTGRREIADFVLEMNDWLLPMQQWNGVARDMQGRFYDPERPEFGPPHASSTAVYVEGLADAAALARSTGEGARANAYERALSRGLRALRQLQFRDDIDAWYISKRKRVLGALRTRVYDNAVRVDSAGHALAAAVKILRLM